MWLLLKRDYLTKIFGKSRMALWTGDCPFLARHQGGSNSLPSKSMEMLWQRKQNSNWTERTRISCIHFWSLVKYAASIFQGMFIEINVKCFPGMWKWYFDKVSRQWKLVESNILMQTTWEKQHQAKERCSWNRYCYLNTTLELESGKWVITPVLVGCNQGLLIEPNIYSVFLFVILHGKQNILASFC